MLVLTAIHDIMKVEALLPSVQPEHAPYQGFAALDKINDHDQAIGYVLDYFGDCLPSFKALPLEQRRVVRFTQAKLQFNHGWLVQAEAPPGALFSKFKEYVPCSPHPNPRGDAYTHVWRTSTTGEMVGDGGR